MVDIRQTNKYAKYLEKLGWKIEKTGKKYSFIKSAPLVGSIVKIQRPEEIDLEALDFVIKRHKAFQVIIEPRKATLKGKPNILLKHGYRLSRNPYLPTKTLHLDLTKSVEDLYQELKKDARYSLRKTKDLRIYAVNKTEKFRASWKDSVDFRRYVPPKHHLDALINSFDEDVLFLVTPDGESGAIFLQAEKYAYYWQAFSSKKGRKALAQYKILWSGIVWAKKQGAEIFDFEGIYDERFPNKKWKGFTHFKKSFSGYEVEYPGAYVKLLLPFR